MRGNIFNESLFCKYFIKSVFLLFVTAALGAALGRIRIKGFSLGSTGGIFSGIVIGWGVITLMNHLTEDPIVGGTAASVIENGLEPSEFMMFFMLLFIAAIGLSAGHKLKIAMNRNFIKLAVMGVLTPLISMCLLLCCIKTAPRIVGDDYNLYQISGLYSGSMTNSGALGTSLDIINNIDVETRYEALSDEEKGRVLEMISAEEVLPSETLTEEQAAAFLDKAKANVSLGYAISFPVGTVVIILAMTLISIPVRRYQPDGLTEEKEDTEVSEQTEYRHRKHGNFHYKRKGGKENAFNAAAFGIVMGTGVLLGSIEIPLGNSVSFTLTTVGGVLVTSLIFGNFNHIGPINMHQNPRMLDMLREFSLLFFMSTIGLMYGYDVIYSFASTGLFIAVMAVLIESIAVLLVIFVGRILLRMDWGLLCGGICGGCTSSVGLGAAMNTIGGEELTVGYGISMPFATLANVVLISLFHSYFFI